MVADIKIGDVVKLKKPHPCGGNDWHVVRLGADVGIKCLECGRKVLVKRAVFERRIRKFIKRAG